MVSFTPFPVLRSSHLYEYFFSLSFFRALLTFFVYQLSYSSRYHSLLSYPDSPPSIPLSIGSAGLTAAPVAAHRRSATPWLLGSRGRIRLWNVLLLFMLEAVWWLPILLWLLLVMFLSNNNNNNNNVLCVSLFVLCAFEWSYVLSYREWTSFYAVHFVMFHLIFSSALIDTTIIAFRTCFLSLQSISLVFVGFWN